MDSKENPRQASGYLLTAACFVIVVAGMREALPIVVPFLLSVFFATICTPPLLWMRKKGIPTGVAILIFGIVILVMGALLGALIGTSVSDFRSNMPVYQERLAAKTALLLDQLRSLGLVITPEKIKEIFDPSVAMKMTANTFAGLSGILTNTFLIVLTVIFILLEVSGFPSKMKQALKLSDDDLSKYGEMTAAVNQYLAIKSIISLGTGITIAIWLAILGVDYPVLWGLLAFMLNYVPNIGSIIAAIPAVLIALVQLGAVSALLTGAGFLVVNIVFGNVIEPRYMGKGLGLSPLVVFLSLVFWGWVLGPVGMLLSVPLTMVLKIMMENREETRWIGVLLGPVSKE
jgi:predicted PurR-regulated permease PerM